jgi:hypothetical protein
MQSKNAPNNYKRSSVDRRHRKIPKLKYLVFGGRRAIIRRKEDGRRLIFLDSYRPLYLIYILFILCLSLIDGFFTLKLIQNGAGEAVPYWDHLIRHNQIVYLISKYLLTAIGSIGILILGDVYLRPFRVQVKRFFPALIAIFVIVIAWQYILYKRLSSL